MKLRTKLTAFSIALIVIAVAVCCALILAFVQSGELRDVSEAGLSDYRAFYDAFTRALDTDLPSQSAVKRSLLVSAFRSVDGFDEFTLRLRDDYICNNVGFDIEKLFQKGVSESARGDLTIQYRTVRVAGTDYFIAHAVLRVQSEQYDISLARDISAVTGGIRALTVKCLLAGLIVTAAGALAMWLIVYRAMRPIDRLRAGAAELARGNYENRIGVKGRDELSELADDFNSMADAIEANMDALRDKSDRQQMFINDLSHELKTPVTSILLRCETLLGRKVPPDTLNLSLERIYDQGKWLEQLSGKLMTLALMQGKIVTRPERVSKLLGAVAETTADALGERGMTLALDCGIDTLPMDFDLMRSALTNLVMNAMKASADGQTITLTARDRTIEVADHGAGISPEDLSRVTEPFYMADRSRSKKHGGAGLGLALVKKIAEAHGARLAIESVLGRGTTVRIEFGTGGVE